MQFVPIRDPIPGRKSGIAADREIATPIRAELIGDDQATALGIEVRSAAPVLDLCRKLVAAGHDRVSALRAYRGTTLSLIVRSIGEAAALDVIDGRFQKWRPRKPSAASPIVRTAPPPARVLPTASDALGGRRWQAVVSSDGLTCEVSLLRPRGL